MQHPRELANIFPRNSNYELSRNCQPPQRDLPKPERYCIHNSIHNRYGYTGKACKIPLQEACFVRGWKLLRRDLSEQREAVKPINERSNSHEWLSLSLSLSLTSRKLEKPTNLTVLRLSKRAIVTLVERRKTSTGCIRSLCIAYSFPTIVFPASSQNVPVNCESGATFNLYESDGIIPVWRYRLERFSFVTFFLDNGGRDLSRYTVCPIWISTLAK